MASKNKYRYIDLSKFIVGTPEYEEAVHKKYNVQSLEDYRKDVVQQHRKQELLKLDTNIIDKYFIKQNINIYENKLKIRDYKIKTGEYSTLRDETYKKNYIICLKHYGVPQEIIAIVETVPASDFNDFFPPLKDYYIYVLGKSKSKGGNIYRIDLGLQDDFIVSVVETLYYIDRVDRAFYDKYREKYGS